MDATTEQIKRFYVKVPGNLPIPFQALYAIEEGQLCIFTQTFLTSQPGEIDHCKLTAEQIEQYGLTMCDKHEVAGDD